MGSAAENLRAWREKRGMTQSQLGGAVGTTGAVISNLETSARGISEGWLRRLAPALDISPGVLLEYGPTDVTGRFIEAALRVPVDSRKHALRVLETYSNDRSEQVA